MWAVWTCLLWTCLILLVQPSLGDRSGGGGVRRPGVVEELPAHKRQSVQYSTLVGPSFINASLNAHAHAPIGQTAYLTCVVRNLHNYTVSWVRARDIHLLTSGETTYTSDHRFVAVNPGGGAQWVLRLHHAQPTDAGTYLCQVSATPPITTTVTLLVTEAAARVYPGREVFLKESSRLVLVCEVRGCPYPAHPTWYRGRQVQEGTEVEEGHVTASSPTPSTESPTTSPSSLSTVTSSLPAFPITLATSISVPHDSTTQASSISIPSTTTTTTTSIPTTTTTTTTTTSTTTTTTTTTPTPIGLPIAKVTLTRPRAKAAHSGVYTCTNSCTAPVNVTLHVLIGDEETAAMQHLSGSLRLAPSASASGLLMVSVVTSWTCRKLTS